MRDSIAADANKQRSREAIWKALAGLRHPPLARTLILPGSSRHEVEVVFTAGIRPENLYLVEKSPAVMAILTRRSKGAQMPPRENIFRMYLSKAAGVLAARGVRLDLAHLDFSSHCESAQMMAEIQAFLRSGVLKDEAYLAVTILAGREKDFELVKGNGVTFDVETLQDPKQLSPIQALTLGDKGRLRHVWEGVGVKATMLQFGRYQNRQANNPMFWGVFRVERRAEPHVPAAVPAFRSGTRQWHDRRS